MNKILLLLGSSIVMVLGACKKNTPGNSPSDYTFEVGISKDSINAGETANFIFLDNPDFISFYSGEKGHQYIYRDRTVLDGGGNLLFRFQTRVRVQPADTLDVLISTDFSGQYDSLNVTNAHWKNMNGLFNIQNSSSALNTYYPSGPTFDDYTNIGDSVIPGKTFYIAFRHKNESPTNIIWNIKKIGLYNVFQSTDIPTITLIDSNKISSDFFAVKTNDVITRWDKVLGGYNPPNYPSLKYNSDTSLVPAGAEHWYISKPMNPNAVLPDAPLVIKNISQNALENFKYKYASPGTYTATFVASYQRLGLEKTIVKEFTIIVH